MAPWTNGTPASRDLSIVNQNRETLSGPQLLHQLVADPTEDKLILDFLTSDGAHVNLTYRQFHRLTDVLAWDIRDRLPGKQNGEHIIPVIIPQCPELYIAWVAALKAGAAFCPVSHDVPPERLKFLVKDVSASFVLTTSNILGFVRHVLPDLDCMPLSLGDLDHRAACLENHGRVFGSLPDVRPSSPAYVMYTSGSTGMPKGVMVSHLSVTQSLLAHDEHIPHFKRFLQFASPTFDVSIFEIFFPFFRGMTLVGCERERMLSDLPATIRLLNADAAELTPTVAGTLLGSRKAAPCLRTLLTIGEMLTPQVVAEFGGSADKPSMLYAMYGPTEAAIHCTVAPRLASDASVRSIGRPFRTVTAFILKESDTLAIAPAGEPGELAIAGQLADGYLNRPDQNKQAFVDLPGHGPIYRTGDRARCRIDGELEILGRITSGQVKLRGQRVELGEVEEVASKAPGVQIAIANIIDDMLVLFCSASHQIRANDIAKTCKSWLPPYMRPSEIVMLPGGVPRLPSGKVDRKALERDFQASRPQVQDNDFVSDTERDMAEIIQDELGRQVDRSTSLWSLGLDSLRAIRVASRLRKQYGQINAASILEAETVAELSRIVMNSRSVEAPFFPQARYDLSDEWIAIEASVREQLISTGLQSMCEKVMPCSSMQVAMLVETSSNERLNFNEIRLQLAPRVSFDDFGRALDTLAQRNEILRAGFVPTGESSMPFAQVVWRNMAHGDLSILRPLQLDAPNGPEGGEVLIRIHHALYDGWSWDLVLDDLNDILSGKDAPRRTQFSQYSSFQHSQILAETAGNNEYWRERFANFVPSAFPALSSTRPQSPSRRCLVEPLSVSYERLSENAQALHCSRETIIEAAWSVLLSCYVDSRDVTIGVVFAGRHQPFSGIESIIGPCLATFPFRVELDALRTVRDLLSYIQRQRIDCLKHGNITLRDINRAAGVTSQERLFDTLCVWQHNDEGHTRDRSKVATTETRDALDYAIVLEFEPHGGKIHLKLTFDEALIPDAHAKLLAAQLDHVTLEMLDNVELGLHDLWQSSSEEILSLSNTMPEKFSGRFGLTTTIAKLANTDPARVAVEFVQAFDPEAGRVEKTTLTYHGLFEKASTVASALQKFYMVGEGDIVALLVTKSIELYVGILGVVLAGAGYLCVDPRTPTDRIRHILSESACRVILTTHEPGFGTQSGAATMVSITELLKQRAPLTRDNWPDLRGHQMAYTVFTSGSTGIPKGVLITRKNLLSNLEDLSRIYPCNPEEDRLLQACSPAFDVSVFEIFWTWHMGMTLCAASNDVLFKDLERLINTLNITHLSMTPSVAALVHPDHVPHVKMLVTAGEPMNSRVFAAWADHGLFQGYGPSETTNICNVRPYVTKRDAPNNVGPALPKTSIFICRRQHPAPAIMTEDSAAGRPPLTFEPVPTGGVGEIWVGGEQVGRGYIDAELTAKAFFEHPQYGRLYRSGDIGRLLVDGTLVIIGREDDQVKLRGQRIELGEINSCLIKCEEVQDAVSMVIDIGQNAKLVAFWTPRQSKMFSSLSQVTRALFHRLENALPSYMIPDVLVSLDQVPLTRQGKVDRRALATFYQTLGEEDLYEMSRKNDSLGDTNALSEHESVIARAISDALGVRPEAIHRDSSFYALGLDSISVIHVARTLREYFPFVEISMILRYPSIGQLMGVLDTVQEDSTKVQPDKNMKQLLDESWKATVTATYAQAGLVVESFLPCTPLQEAMATSSTSSSTAAYQNTLRFEVRGDVSKLRAAWAGAISRHQLLRTGFASTESAETPFVQVVLKNFELPWLTDDGHDTSTRDLPFLMLPPWKLRLSRQDDGPYELSLEMHHCLYDAEAMSVLLNEIQSEYLGQQPPLPISFERYLNYMLSLRSEDTDRFWRQRLGGVACSRLAEVVKLEDRISPTSTAISARKAILSLSEFQRCSRKISCTPLALLQTAWSRLLSCLLERQDICFGNVLSGRNLPIEGIERIIAPCFNTIPMRVQLQHEQSNLVLCHRIQETNLELLPYQPSSLRRIQQQNSSDSRALFDTLLLFQQSELQLDQRIWTLLGESGDMPFPFILEILTHEDSDAMSLKLHSQSASENFLSHLLNCFDTLLIHTARYPQSRASDYSALTPILPDLQPKSDTGRSAVLPTEERTDGLDDSASEVSETEKLVMDVLTQLKPDISQRISKSKSIYRLGFDSISAAQIAARLRKHGYNISRADILEAVNIQKIAAVCDAARSLSLSQPAFDLEAFDRKRRPSICLDNKIDPGRVQAIRPCTPTQSGILSHYLRSSGLLYFNHMDFQLEEDVDLELLRKSWKTAQDLHEMLRTGFVETDDPRYPFAMVTYNANAIKLPWNDGKVDGHNPTADAGSPANFTEPPWQLRLSKNARVVKLELSMLHALYDATSVDIILRDVSFIYHGSQPPKAVALNPVISSILALSAEESSSQFWSEVSADLCPTHFPDMRIYVKKEVQFHVACHRSKLSVGAAEQACANVGTTMQAVCASAWALLLSAYTTQDHITFGVVMSGRDFELEEHNTAAFPCITTVPFAIEVSQDLPDLLRRTTRRCAEMIRHQHSPISSIKRWTGVEDELFDTIIALQKYDIERGPRRPWTLVKDDATAEYAVSLEIIPAAEGQLDFQLTFRDDVVPKKQASYILQEFDALFMALLSHVGDPVPKALKSVVPARDERIATDVSYLHELVELTVEQKPQTTALEFVTDLNGSSPTKRTWTYWELNLNGNRIAHLLQGQGAKVGELVAVCFDKCPEASFAILGVLKAGCGYVAIDPGAPKARKEFILQDSSCKIVLTTRDRVLDFPPGTVAVFAIDEGTWLHLPDERPLLARKITAEDTCYCLYTSGTTGTPKGCLISHDSAVQAMLSFQRIFQGRWNETSRWLQFASFHFDVSVLEQFWSWSVGICVTSAPRDLMFEDLPGFINTLNITHLDLTPSLARLLTPEEVPSLCQGVFIVGGEQVRQDILDTWGDSHCLYNFYGPSEVTIGCTVHRQVPKTAKPTNIGQQWDNVGSFVLEPTSQRPVLRGAIGELCLSGPLVGKGYLNRPELTAEKFVLLEEYKTRVYRTGDLVRLLHDNSFEFLGRIDDQVKLRGQRLEIGEINHVALSASSSLKDVVTMVIKHPTQQKDQLVTFFATERRKSKNERPSIILSPDTRDLAAKLHQRCAEKLPVYMVPTYVIRVSSIPLSTNNKVDHKTLKALFERSSLVSGQPVTDDQAQQESEVPGAAKEVIEVLGTFLQIPTSSIQPGSRLFELGLDSISAIGLSRAFKKHGFKSSDVATILRHPVVRDLAQAINQKTTSDHDQSVAAARGMIQSFAIAHHEAVIQSLGVTKQDIEHIAPCTPLQEGMVSKVLRNEHSDTIYFTRFGFELGRDIDLARLRDAWNSAQQLVSVLRTYFVTTGDGVAQVVLHNGHNGEALEVGERNKQYPDVTSPSFREWIQSVQSLGKALPWKVTLSTSGESRYMVLDIFHGLYDGVSLPLLLNVVARLYDDPNENVRVGLQFYETLAYGPLRSVRGEKDFWLSRLGTLQPLRIPLTRSNRKGETGHIHLKQHISDTRPQRLCRQLDVTTSAYFQASFLLVLQKMFNVNPMIGAVVSGRALTDLNAEEVIGPMFNTIPFGINNLSQGSTVADLIRACHRFNVDLVPYQHSPLRRVAKCLGHTPNTDLFDTLFVFQKPRSDVGPSQMWHEIPSQSTPDYPLNMEVEQLDHTFTVTLVARTEYFSEADARVLLEMYLNQVQDLDNVNSVLSADFSKTQPTAQVNDKPQLGNARNGVLEDTHWSKTELAIRAQVAALASVDEETISPHRPTLFELGLDSIEGMKLAARLRNIGLKVPVSAIMRSPTVAGLAREAETAHNRTDDGQGTISMSGLQATYRKLLQNQGVELDTVERVLPVTPMQEGLLLESEKYLNTMVFQLKPKVNTDRMIEAWKTVARLEPVLRTRFATIEAAEVQGSFVQYVTRNDDLVQVVHDKTLDELLQTMRRDAARRHVQDQKTDIHILLDHQENALLLLSMPHALYDAWSLHLLHQQVARVYHHPAEDDDGDQNPSTTLPYERHLEDVLSQAQSSQSRRFWRGQVSKIRPSLLKGPLSRPEQSTSFLLQAPSSKTLVETTRFCQQQGVTLQSLGLACWTVVLAHYTRQLDVCFGLVLSGRTTEGSDAIVFPTFNTVVFRPMIHRHSTKREVLKAVHDAAVRVSEHQQFPLREALRYARDQDAETPLFDSLFTFQKLPEAGGDTMSLYDELNVDGTSIQPPYPVNIELEGRNNALVWTIAVQVGVAEKPFGERVLQELNSALSSFMNMPEEPLLQNDGPNVSICGLPGISLTARSPTARIDHSPPSSEQGIDGSHDTDTWTTTETTIKEVLAEISGTDKERIQKTTGIFHLGLDSVSAIKVAGLLRKKGIRLPVSEIIKAQTIEKMAAAADQPKVEGEVASSPPNASHQTSSAFEAVKKRIGIPQTDMEDVMLCTGGQIYMLDMWSASDGRLFYPTFRLQLAGISGGALRKAFDKLVEQIPTLRTVFVNIADNDHQETWQVVLKSKVAHNYQLPWSMDITDRENGSLLTLRLHHALYDAVSFQRLVSTLGKLCQDVDSPLQLHTSPQEFVSRMTAKRAEAKQFWTSYLHLRGDHHSHSSFQAGSFESPRIEKFEPHILRTVRIRDRLKGYGISLQAMFFAAYAQVYSRICRQAETDQPHAPRDVVMGVYLANRSLDIDGLTELIAPTFNIVPLKVRLEGTMTLVDSALQVQSDLAELGKAEHCAVSMRDIYAWTGVQIDTFVNFLSLPDQNDHQVLEDDKLASVSKTDNQEESVSKTDNQQESVVVTHAPIDSSDKSELDTTSPFLKGTKPHVTTTEWCMPAIDIEAKVEDGYLGIGVFVPQDRVDEMQVKQMMERMEHLLSSF